MSAIFGLIHFDSRPIDSDVDAMRPALERWGPDGLMLWRGDHAAIGLALQVDTPEGDRGHGPHSTDRFTVSAAGRLDNRAELIKALDLGSEAAPVSDAFLMFRAYERWGDDCPARLLGDWSLAAWHPADRRLFLARDQSGNTSIEYHYDGRRFVYAPARQALLQVPGVPTGINELYVAQQLVFWGAFMGPDTAHAGVHRLPPAHALTVTPAGMRPWRYWRLEDAPEIALGSTGEYADAMREQIRQAVVCRLRSANPLGITLSAGLDSGAVAALAAPAVLASGRILTAYTAVPRHHVRLPVGIADEFELAAATATLAGGIEHVAVDSADISPLDGIEWQLAAHGEPGLASANYYWWAGVLGAARGRVVLTGMMGNALFAWSGLSGSHEALAALGSGAFRRAASIAFRAAERAPVAIGLRTALARSNRQPWSNFSLIHPHFAERLRLLERMEAAGYNPWVRPPERTGRATRELAIAPGRESLGAVAAQIGAASGTIVRSPLRDIRLLTFAHGIPDQRWKGAQRRSLLREAMRSHLPVQVLRSTERGVQAADVASRLRECQPQTRELLAVIEASTHAREVIDVVRLRRLFEGIGDHPDGSDAGTAALFLRGLCAALFVARAAG